MARVEANGKELPPLITLAQFCAITGLTRRQVWDLRDAKAIRVFRVSGHGYAKYYKWDACRVAGIE